MREAVAARDRELATIEKPFVVRRDEIPASSAAEDRELDRRPFQAHQLLASAMVSSETTLSWLEVPAGQYVAPRRHQEPSLLLILRGSGELIGSEKREIEQGDVLTLPAGHDYGFSAVAPGGIEALHVVLRAGNRDESEREVTLHDLLARNASRASAALNTPYFRMLHDGTLSTARARQRFRHCARVFSDLFQTFLFTREAMCRDPEYQAIFNAHLLEEIGHNNMLEASDDPRIFADPTLRATLSWFCHQMLVLDNVGKAVLNLVLETAGYHFHSLAKPVFEQDEGQVYFDTHAEGDETHKDMGLELFEKQHRATYRDLIRLLDDGYDMLDAVTQRIFDLVVLAKESS